MIVLKIMITLPSMSTGLAKVAVEGESAGAESLSYYQTIIAIAVIIIAVIPNAIIIFGWL